MRIFPPNKIFVSESQIHGLGVFSNAFIKEGEIIEECPIFDLKTKDIFAESMSRAIIEVAPENCASFEAMIGKMAYQKIGTVGGTTFSLNDISMNVETMQDIYYNTFKSVVEGDL